MCANRMTFKKIEKALGVSTTTVQHVLRGFDEKMNLVGETARKWRGKDYKAILERVRDQRRPLADVCNDPDLPDFITWRKYVNAHPEFAAKLEEINHRMPYSYQARVRNFSPRFQKDCERLRASGMTFGKVAKALDVSTVTVTRVLRGGRRATRVKKKLKK